MFTKIAKQNIFLFCKYVHNTAQNYGKTGLIRKRLYLVHVLSSIIDSIYVTIKIQGALAGGAASQCY